MERTPRALSTGVRISVSMGGQRRHFAYTFQVSDDAMQTDVHKALDPFYTKINCSILRQ